MPARKPEQYLDNRSVAFSDVRFILGEEKWKWPSVDRVKDPNVCAMMHNLYASGGCWNCGDRCLNRREPNRIEAHHMFAGQVGKSDEMCALTLLCTKCHGQGKETIVPLGRLLYLKWKMDRCHVDWVRSTQLHGRFLPDLITEPT